METVNLAKGQKIDLTKASESLKTIDVHLNWKEGSFDVDAFAFAIKDGKVVEVLFFNSPKVDGKPTILDGGLVHSGDDLTGAGGEVIKTTLDKIPTDIEAVIFGVNIYNPGSNNFGMVQDAGISFEDADQIDVVFGKYDLNEDYSAFNAVIVGKVYRHNGEWKAQAIGEGVNGDINEIAGIVNNGSY